MSENFLERKNYSTRTLNTYELLGSYFVDLYYNHLYQEAHKFKNSGKVASITEGYKHAVIAFLGVIDSQSANYQSRYYMTLLTGINNWFRQWTGHQTLTMSDCVETIIVEFIPNDYYGQFNKDQKRNVLREILTNVIKNTTGRIATEFLRLIIDDHENNENVEIIKEMVVDILLTERHNMYEKFVMKQSGETVNKSTAITLQQNLKKYIKENQTLKEHISKLSKDLDDHKKTISVKDQQLKLLIDKFKLLADKHKHAQEELATYQSTSQATSQLVNNRMQRPKPLITNYDMNNTNDLLSKHVKRINNSTTKLTTTNKKHVVIKVDKPYNDLNETNNDETNNDLNDTNNDLNEPTINDLNDTNNNDDTNNNETNNDETNNDDTTIKSKLGNEPSLFDIY